MAPDAPIVRVSRFAEKIRFATPTPRPRRFHRDVVLQELTSSPSPLQHRPKYPKSEHLNRRCSSPVGS